MALQPNVVIAVFLSHEYLTVVETSFKKADENARKLTKLID